MRDSGIPPRGGLGAARNEIIAIGIAAVVLIALAVSFWIGAA